MAGRLSPEADPWFHKADNDLRMAEIGLGDANPPTDAVCFHAQQAIEKYLKGLLAHCGAKPPRVHDLTALLTEASKHITRLRDFEEQCEAISDFAVSSRYPSDFPDPEIDQAKQALQVAREIRKIVADWISAPG